MNPQYKGYFNSDANLPDDIRKRNPYDEKKADQYRQKFIDLMVLAGKMEAPKNEESGAEANNNNTFEEENSTEMTKNATKEVEK